MNKQNVTYYHILWFSCAFLPENRRLSNPSKSYLPDAESDLPTNYKRKRELFHSFSFIILVFLSLIRIFDLVIDDT